MKNLIIVFEKFESAMMEKFIETNESIKEVLKKQYEGAVVLNREFTGKGFFTHFSVLEDIEKIPNDELDMKNTGVWVNGKNADFILFIRNGLITSLEGYMLLDDTWPDVITSYGFYDSTTGKIIETYGNSA